MNLGAKNNRFDTIWCKDIDVENGIPSGGGGSVNNPLGTIISYMGTTPPDNYLACDGTVYDIDDYQELADFINAQFGSYDFFGGNGTTTFAVPDLRGEFLRGTGTNSHTNQGSGASVGTHQDGTLHIDVGSTDNNVIQLNKSDRSGTFERASLKDYHYNRTGYIATTGNFTSSVNTTNGLGTFTSRPTNTSVLYCIRYNTPYADTNTYSTTEQRIGTWIDGKPLYQKTYSATSPATVNTSAEVAYLPQNVNPTNVKDIKGILYASSEYIYGVNHYMSDTDMIGVWVRPNGKISAKVGNEGCTNCVLYITLKYTKTTD